MEWPSTVPINHSSLEAVKLKTENLKSVYTNAEIKIFKNLIPLSTMTKQNIAHAN